MNRTEEIAAKREALRAVLADLGLDGAVLSTPAMFSWYTAGGENRVALSPRTGTASIVATTEADWVVTDNIEAPRLRAEVLPPGAGFEVVELPWHQEGSAAARISELAAGRQFVSDEPLPGLSSLPPAPEEVLALSWRLLEPEIERYRELGREASFAIEGACRRAEPGMTEEEVSAVLAEEVCARGLVPSVILVGADERIEQFRHPLPTEKRIDTSLMVVLCARRHGLVASLTRMLHFGRALPEELAARHRAVQAVDSALILATREGRSVEEVLQHGLDSYDAGGFKDEWKLHHQGGPTGYQGRVFRARPGEKRPVLAPQAFAWNPSITGTKSEDTILSAPGGGQPEFLTTCLDWPVADVEWNGQTVPRADILLL